MPATHSPVAVSRVWSRATATKMQESIMML